jgi:predicted transcriptional regulator
MSIDNINKLIRKRRKALGIDQGELSRIAGISVHALSNIESGAGNPTLKTITKVLDALGLEIKIQPKS